MRSASGAGAAFVRRGSSGNSESINAETAEYAETAEHAKTPEHREIASALSAASAFSLLRALPERFVDDERGRHCGVQRLNRRLHRDGEVLVCTGHDIGRQAGALSPDQYRGRPGIIHPEDRLAIAPDGSGNPAAVAPRLA